MKRQTTHKHSISNRRCNTFLTHHFAADVHSMKVLILALTILPRALHSSAVALLRRLVIVPNLTDREHAFVVRSIKKVNRIVLALQLFDLTIDVSSQTCRVRQRRISVICQEFDAHPITELFTLRSILFTFELH